MLHIFAALHILRLNTNYNDIFNQLCGNKPDIKVLKDNRNRPYAFVQFETVDEAKTALKKVHGFILNRRPLRCERARVNRTIFISPRSNSNQSRKVCFFYLSFGLLFTNCPNNFLFITIYYRKLKLLLNRLAKLKN